MATTVTDQPRSAKAAQELLNSRPIRKVAILGANGTMGFQSAALFTLAGIEVVFLARTKEKAEEGLAAAQKGVRSSTVAEFASTGSYDADMQAAVADADIVFEALAENFAIKKEMFDKVEQWRRPGSIVATVTSGLSITKLAEGRGEDFQKNFIGLHFFNPPNVIVGTELIAGEGPTPNWWSSWTCSARSGSAGS
jgi:3-hydroxyacyl-CoA dehydrogenase